MEYPCVILRVVGQRFLEGDRHFHLMRIDIELIDKGISQAEIGEASGQGPKVIVGMVALFHAPHADKGLDFRIDSELLDQGIELLEPGIHDIPRLLERGQVRFLGFVLKDGTRYLGEDKADDKGYHQD
jgi:hypothetical protein